MNSMTLLSHRAPKHPMNERMKMAPPQTMTPSNTKESEGQKNKALTKPKQREAGALTNGNRDGDIELDTLNIDVGATSQQSKTDQHQQGVENQQNNSGHAINCHRHFSQKGKTYRRLKKKKEGREGGREHEWTTWTFPRG